MPLSTLRVRELANEVLRETEARNPYARALGRELAELIGASDPVAALVIDILIGGPHAHKRALELSALVLRLTADKRRNGTEGGS